MRSHLFLPWLATVTYAIDPCGILVSNPIFANLIDAPSSCSEFQQSTASLCARTVTSTKTITKNVATTSTLTREVEGFQTVIISKFTTFTTTVPGTLSLTTTTVTASVDTQPTGPIPGSNDMKKRDAAVIPCPRLIGPPVPSPFNFFCVPTAFSSACAGIGISATIQTTQKTVTATRTSTVTVSIEALTTVVSTHIVTTTEGAVLIPVTTTVSGDDGAATATATIASFPGLFHLTFLSRAKGDTEANLVSTTDLNTGTRLAGGGSVNIVPPNDVGAVFMIDNFLNLKTDGGQITVAGNGDYVVRFMTGISPVYFYPPDDPRLLLCELSQGESGTLSCVSGNAPNQTTLFQTCNNDGLLYHGPGLLNDCTQLTIYTPPPGNRTSIDNSTTSDSGQPTTSGSPYSVATA